MDDNGHEHLAVVGEERDPRDGHYNYYAEKPFSLIRPLACQNRTKVHEYLEAVGYRLPDCLSQMGHLQVMQEKGLPLVRNCHHSLQQFRTSW